MICGLLQSAINKIICNIRYILIASIGIIISTFIVLIIFMLGHAANDIVLQYCKRMFPSIGNVTFIIEGGKKYELTEGELKNINLFDKESSLSLYCYSKEKMHASDYMDEYSFCIQGVIGKTNEIKINSGRYFDDSEYWDSNCQNIVISKKLATNCFNYDYPIGNKMILKLENGCSYEMNIIGVYELDTNNNETISDCIMGYNSFYNLFCYEKEATISKFDLIIDNPENADVIIETIKNILDKRFDDEEYEISFSYIDITKSYKSIIRLFRMLLLIGTLIVFIVSGLSIRNVIVSIMKSYTHVIGIEKSIGASNTIIIIEYLIQGIIIALLGSVGGFFIFEIFKYVLNNNTEAILILFANKLKVEVLKKMSLKLYITFSELLVTMFISICTVIICCLNPIRRQSELKIVDALKE